MKTWAAGHPNPCPVSASPSTPAIPSPSAVRHSPPPLEPARTTHRHLADALPLHALHAQIALDPVHRSRGHRRPIESTESPRLPVSGMSPEGTVIPPPPRRDRAVAPVLAAPRGEPVRPPTRRISASNASSSPSRRRCTTRTTRKQARATCLRPCRRRRRRGRTAWGC